MKKGVKMLVWIIPLLVFFAAVGLFLLWSVRLELTVTTYAVKSTKLTAPIRIALLSDLHSGQYGEGQQELIEAVGVSKADAYFLVGDIIDDHGAETPAWELVEALGEMAPCFYVTGNHEERTNDTERMKDTLRGYGVLPLDGETAPLTVRGQTVLVCGADDPYQDEETFADTLEQFGKEAAQEYRILLSHRPERIAAYEASGCDLILSGHAHGGQVRIPGLLNGLLAPGQGLFPKYAGGCYPIGARQQLVVSRGLAKNHKLRIFNPPELVIIDLLPEK